MYLSIQHNGFPGGSVVKNWPAKSEMEVRAKAPILWPPLEKTVMLGKIEGRRRRDDRG